MNNNNDFVFTDNKGNTTQEPHYENHDAAHFEYAVNSAHNTEDHNLFVGKGKNGTTSEPPEGVLSAETYVGIVVFLTVVFGPLTMISNYLTGGGEDFGAIDRIFWISIKAIPLWYNWVSVKSLMKVVTTPEDENAPWNRSKHLLVNIAGVLVLAWGYYAVTTTFV